MQSVRFFATIGTDKYSDDRTDDHHYNKNSADFPAVLRRKEDKKAGKIEDFSLIQKPPIGGQEKEAEKIKDFFLEIGPTSNFFDSKCRLSAAKKEVEMSSEIRDINLAGSGEQKIEWVKRNCDLLRTLEEEFSRTKPFAGKKITLSVHLEAKTANLCKVLAAGGA